MARNFPDWLDAFVEYAGYGEAPRRMYFWVGVGAVAGALRRKVWIDQVYFRWHPNFFIVLVAPPGIISKTTTADTAMNLLREIPGIKFGPDVVTWQALVKAFAESCEMFEYQGDWIPMSAITLVSGEFGNLLNPQDREMVDLLVSLWDGRKTFEKVTKMSGNDLVQNPWINFVACTTPEWIAGNFPEYLIGGGFTSRCLFVYANEKEKYVAYPSLSVPSSLMEKREKLIADLEDISTLAGQFHLAPEAIAWGTAWYEEHYRKRPEMLDDERFGGYIARKQTHIHKLAMVLSASQRSDLTIGPEELQVANEMVTDLERDMPLVFSKIGRSPAAVSADRLLHFIRRRERLPVSEAYAYVQANFPDAREFDGILAGLIKAGFVQLGQEGSEFMLTAVKRT
jgi:hypothetical protein